MVNPHISASRISHFVFEFIAIILRGCTVYGAVQQEEGRRLLKSAITLIDPAVRGRQVASKEHRSFVRAAIDPAYILEQSGS